MAELFSTSLINDANLEGYYRFETGALTTDSSGDNETLTNNNTVAESSGGKYGYAADFDTSNTNKNFTRASNYGITNNSISMGLWVKMRTEIGSSIQELMLHENTTTGVYYALIYDYNGGTRRIAVERFREGTGRDLYLTHNITLGTTDYHHIAFTCDGTTLRLYVDGTESTSSAIGANGSGGGNIFRFGGGLGWPTALIDDGFIFSRKLTDAEISTLYNPIAGSALFFNQL